MAQGDGFRRIGLIEPLRGIGDIADKHFCLRINGLHTGDIANLILMQPWHVSTAEVADFACFRCQPGNRADEERAFVRLVRVRGDVGQVNRTDKNDKLDIRKLRCHLCKRLAHLKTGCQHELGTLRRFAQICLPCLCIALYLSNFNAEFSLRFLHTVVKHIAERGIAKAIAGIDDAYLHRRAHRLSQENLLSPLAPTHPDEARD